MNQVFIGRQAIFDRRLQVHAHELLFRAAATACAGPLDDSAATASVIVNAFIEFDVERIIGPHRAFINVDREFLLDMVWSSLFALDRSPCWPRRSKRSTSTTRFETSASSIFRATFSSGRT